MIVIVLKGYTEHEGFEIEGVFEDVKSCREYIKEESAEMGEAYPNFENLGYDWLDLEQFEVM